MKKFNIPEVNAKVTRKAVEKCLEDYRRFLLTLPKDVLPAITPAYSILPPVATNAFHSSTEDAAIERVLFEKERNDYLKWLHEAVNTLKDDERYILIKRYMEWHMGYDPDIWLELGIGKTKYYQVKGEAMLRLAFSLKIEVYRKKYEGAKSA